MPGPMSAPNGNESLVYMKKRAESHNINSGKTALKKGKIEHARTKRVRKFLTGKERREQESYE